MTKNKKDLLIGFGFIIAAVSLAFNSKPPKYKNPMLKDEESLKNDWTRVGNSLQGGVNEIKKSQECYKIF